MGGRPTLFGRMSGQTRHRAHRAMSYVIDLALLNEGRTELLA